MFLQGVSLLKIGLPLEQTPPNQRNTHECQTAIQIMINYGQNMPENILNQKFLSILKSWDNNLQGFVFFFYRPARIKPKPIITFQAKNYTGKQGIRYCVGFSYISQIIIIIVETFAFFCMEIIKNEKNTSQTEVYDQRGEGHVGHHWIFAGYRRILGILSPALSHSHDRNTILLKDLVAPFSPFW